MLIQHAAPFNVQRVADEGMLLPEENPGSYYLDDALHWILVYTELRQFTASMIVASERGAESLSFAARVDAEIDRNMLRVHDERYRRRCEYWYGRASELSDEESRRAAGG